MYLDETTNERPLTAAQQAAEDAHWDSIAADKEDGYQASLSNACMAIRSCPVDLLDAAFIAQVIYTLSTAASAAKLESIVDCLDAAVCEFE